MCSIETFGLGLREQEKFYRNARIAAYKPTHDRQLLSLYNNSGDKFALCIIIPIMIALKFTDISLYNDFVDGKTPQPLLDVIGNGNVAGGFCAGLLCCNETYNENGQGTQKVVLLSDKLKAVYEAIFKKDSERNPWRETAVGEYTFSSETKQILLRTVSFMSEFADFE